MDSHWCPKPGCSRSNLFAAFLAVIPLLMSIAAIPAVGSEFVPIDYPGASVTNAFDINSSDEVVGIYVSDGSTHGFLLTAGGFTSIDYPKAIYTSANANNDLHVIVGRYQDARNTSHGFIRSPSGEYASFDFPDATFTGAAAISNTGDIVGRYVNADGVTQFYLLRDGCFSTIAFPDEVTNIDGVYGIAGNTIIGRYVDALGTAHGFREELDDTGSFTNIDCPDSSYTSANAINDSFEIVGRCDFAGLTHALILNDGEFSTFDYPCAVLTTAIGVSSLGDIAGRYVAADTSEHGYVRYKD